MKIFDHYIFKNLAIATGFVAVTLSAVVLLTQSLKFLELVIEAGASSGAFWVLTLLALPRLLEVILPLSLMAATLFIYNRMTNDSELIVVRSAGYSPAALARPAIILALCVSVMLLVVTLWVAPKSLSSLQQMRSLVKAQFSTLLFREGVFNQVGKGLTVYVRERGANGALHGLMVHDERVQGEVPSTILAQRGALAMVDGGYQVVVYEGTRQVFDPEKNALQRLNFNRYTIDLPNSDPVRQRWAQPDERTIFELLKPDKSVERDVDSLREFKVELHRRFLAPLLALVFTLISCAALLVGPVDRRGQIRRIIFAVGSVVVIQALFMAAHSVAGNSNIGVFFMYGVVFVPMAVGAFVLSGYSEQLRRKILYKPQELLELGAA